jgi:hypothetical protein
MDSLVRPVVWISDAAKIGGGERGVNEAQDSDAFREGASVSDREQDASGECVPNRTSWEKWRRCSSLHWKTYSVGHGYELSRGDFHARRRMSR